MGSGVAACWHGGPLAGQETWLAGPVLAFAVSLPPDPPLTATYIDPPTQHLLDEWLKQTVDFRTGLYHRLGASVGYVQVNPDTGRMEPSRYCYEWDGTKFPDRAFQP